MLWIHQAEEYGNVTLTSNHPRGASIGNLSIKLTPLDQIAGSHLLYHAFAVHVGCSSLFQLIVSFPRRYVLQFIISEFYVMLLCRVRFEAWIETVFMSSSVCVYIYICIFV